MYSMYDNDISMYDKGERIVGFLCLVLSIVGILSAVVYHIQEPTGVVETVEAVEPVEVVCNCLE